MKQSSQVLMCTKREGRAIHSDSPGQGAVQHVDRESIQRSSDGHQLLLPRRHKHLQTSDLSSVGCTQCRMLLGARLRRARHAEWGDAFQWRYWTRKEAHGDRACATCRALSGRSHQGPRRHWPWRQGGQQRVDAASHQRDLTGKTSGGGCEHGRARGHLCNSGERRVSELARSRVLVRDKGQGSALYLHRTVGVFDTLRHLCRDVQPS